MAGLDELKAMPWQVVDPFGGFAGGYPNKADAQAACKEMNDYAKEQYWRVAPQAN